MRHKFFTAPVKSEHLAVIHPRDNFLILQQLRFEEELRSPEELKLPRNIDIQPRELSVAMELIKEYSAPFYVGQYKDEYKSELLKIIKAKAGGKKITPKRMEVVVPAEKIISPEPFTHTAMNTGKNLLDPSAETLDLKVNSHLLHFTHLDKLYWPEDKLAKRDLLEYYHRAASYMLPFLKGRPMSLHRHPEGYAGPGFYQKDVTGKVPDWVETLPYRSEEEPDQAKKFLVCTDEASLLLMANLGCIEINPWNSTVKDPDHPDWCVLDLDPDKNNTFDHVIEVARMAHNILDAAGVPAYCKTSGSTGLHIYIPLNARYTYGQSAEFARLIVNLVQHRLPELTSVERHLSERKGKIYLDFLQNKIQATLAAPFSVRPKPQAPVSMPLHWDEVKKGLKVTDFTIRNAVPLLEERSELFKGVLGKGIDMPAVLEKLEAGWKEAK